MTSLNQINLWKDKLSFLGHFPLADWHTHGAPVLFVGVSGDFTIEFRDGVKARCSSAIVDAGVAHRTDPGGELMALFYLSPYSLESLRFRSLFLENSTYQLDVIKRPENVKGFCQLLQQFDIESVLGRELPNISYKQDKRIYQSLDIIHESPLPQSRDDISKSVHLSNSRFNHLFSQSLNVSYRQYRQWVQLGKALQHYQTEKHLTQAALSAGFSDSAHFSNTYRKFLGISPTSVLGKNTELNIVRS